MKTNKKDRLALQNLNPMPPIQDIFPIFSL